MLGICKLTENAAPGKLALGRRGGQLVCLATASGRSPSDTAPRPPRHPIPPDPPGAGIGQRLPGPLRRAGMPAGVAPGSGLCLFLGGGGQTGARDLRREAGGGWRAAGGRPLLCPAWREPPGWIHGPCTLVPVMKTRRTKPSASRNSRARYSFAGSTTKYEHCTQSSRAGGVPSSPARAAISDAQH